MSEMSHARESPPLRRSLALSFLTIGLLSLSLVSWTAATEGSSIATRNATHFVMPLGLTWLMTILVTFVAWHQRVRRLALLSAIALILLTARSGKSADWRHAPSQGRSP